LSNEGVLVGDSPTIKHYIEPREYLNHVEESRREGLAGGGVSVTGGVVSGEVASSWYSAGCSSLYCQVHKILNPKTLVIDVGSDTYTRVDVNVWKGLLPLNLELNLPDSSLRVIDFNVKGSGLLSAWVRVRGGSRRRLVLKFNLPKGRASYIGVSEECGGCLGERAVILESSRTLRVEEFIRVESSSFKGKNIVIAEDGSILDWETRGVAGGDSPLLHLHGLAVSVGGSTTALRGVVAVDKHSRRGSIVYGLDSIQLNGRSLMQPKLEVYTGEVEEARHYARNVRFTADQIFYLSSRGLSTREAYVLLLTGLAKTGVEDPGISFLLEDVFRQVLLKLGLPG